MVDRLLNEDENINWQSLLDKDTFWFEILRKISDKRIKYLNKSKNQNNEDFFDKKIDDKSPVNDENFREEPDNEIPRSRLITDNSSIVNPIIQKETSIDKLTTNNNTQNGSSFTEISSTSLNNRKTLSKLQETTCNDTVTNLKPTKLSLNEKHQLQENTSQSILEVKASDQFKKELFLHSNENKKQLNINELKSNTAISTIQTTTKISNEEITNENEEFFNSQNLMSIKEEREKQEESHNEIIHSPFSSNNSASSVTSEEIKKNEV